ncbi:PLP-dependent aminotransferase family protein [Nonomuraea sp. NPDC046570]|uniref:aminotransferase-like domain-containing protein n=1 Tax=Nonomuraea sp. NPDC046570 TaxID=3155255 RepID=UPI0033E447D0
MEMWIPSIERAAGTRAQAIADAIGADIAAGRLQAGDRLPPQRDLAEALALSPNTVMRAYSQAVRRGYVVGEVGRGTYVRPADAVPQDGPVALTRRLDGPVDLSLGLPFIGSAGDALSATLAEIARSRDLGALLDNGEARGRHADAGAAWLCQLGLAAESERIMLVNGAQQGICATLLALLRPGDTLLTEQLTYAPLKALAGHLGVQIHALSMDDEGLLPDSLETACRSAAPKLLYCTPTLQTPTAATMSEGRREHIARIAAAHDLVIVEDDVFGFLPDGRPLPLAVFAPDHTVFITSVSKSMAPGLRVGYVHAPDRLFPAISAAIAVSSWMPPPLMAEIASRWIEDGTATRLNEAQRSHAARRQAMARELLSDHVYHAHPQGPHVWLELPEYWTSRAFAAAAERSGVLLNPAESFATGAAAPAAVRLSLSHEISDERVRQGLTIVAALLDAPADGQTLVI